jgi:hypothetical protein
LQERRVPAAELRVLPEPADRACALLRARGALCVREILVERGAPPARHDPLFGQHGDELREMGNGDRPVLLREAGHVDRLPKHALQVEAAALRYRRVDGLTNHLLGLGGVEPERAKSVGAVSDRPQ